MGIARSNSQPRCGLFLFAGFLSRGSLRRTRQKRESISQLSRAPGAKRGVRPSRPLRERDKMKEMTADNATFLLHSVYLPALKNETKLTKNVIAAVPADKSDHRPDPFSKTAMELVRHIA